VYCCWGHYLPFVDMCIYKVAPLQSEGTGNKIAQGIESTKGTLTRATHLEQPIPSLVKTCVGVDLV